MSLVLNLYTAKDSKTTKEDVQTYLASQPHFRSVEAGESVYENEATGVYFVVGNEPVEDPVKDFNSLDIACIINYARPEFFALEIFPQVERICNELGLLIDIEQEGKPSKVNVSKLHKDWLSANDGFLRTMQKEHDAEDSGLAYMPRKASNELWQFLVRVDALQDELSGSGKDVYVAKAQLFSDSDHKVIVAVAWPSAIPIVLPPHTDMVLIMKEVQKRRLFKKESDLEWLGYVSVERLLKEFGSSFIRHKDGSIELLQAEADKIRDRILSMTPDISGQEQPGESHITPDHIVDVKG